MSLALVAAMFGPYSDCALAQTYPNKSISFISPYPPGSGTDIIARIIGDKLTKSLGQTVVVLNKAGAAGAIGGEAAAKAPPDGHTLIIVSTALSVNMSVNKVNYDLVKDFEPVILVGIMPQVVVVPSTLPVKSLKEFVELAKSKPGQFNFSSGGIGGSSHLSGEMLKTAAKIDIAHVPYKGTPEAMADLMESRVQIMFTPLASGIPYIETGSKPGKLRALAVTGDKRSPELPNVPSAAEAGFPTLDTSSWFAVLVPAGTPRAIVTKLNTEMNKILGMSDVKERLSQIGVENPGSTIEAVADFIKKDVAKWAKAIKDAGIKMK